MSYLICKKCGGYYKLKEGEKPDEFEACECGGTLRYVQNFNAHFDEELDPINEFNICPDCGIENSAGEKYCKSCGKMIKDTKNEENNSDANKNVLKSTSNKWILRAVAIIVGILIVVIPTLIFVDSNYALLLLLIGGIVASLIAGGKSEDGAINGIVVGVIAAILILSLRGNFLFIDDVLFNIEIFIFEMSGAILILALFGLIGGVIGISIREFLIKAEK
ncbi:MULTISPECIES: TIGR04086 family membrane protein [Methanobacterium]|jgi:uncharacterized membrane protein YeaQ/YmgE (transglycosylase-associated protein family)|uniref:DUF5518 domain-containing protein n=1 Tax=Methanobacterium veterum TaxID=408577 RepID=A0A9E5DPV3_9EURY|nr:MULTISPECIES: TIGR04086 family membrane protein [Methanobacterium]MCZ3366767.1 DUF5518 domain-containing protein [Methanobacterium veterum]MCZ3374087.1 DUF5518 domain-containing protein [Methanobacterium veterum]